MTGKRTPFIVMAYVLLTAATGQWPSGKDRFESGSEWTCVAPNEPGIATKTLTFRIVPEQRIGRAIVFAPNDVLSPARQPAGPIHAEHPLAYTDKSLNLFGAATEWTQHFANYGVAVNLFWNGEDRAVLAEIRTWDVDASGQPTSERQTGVALTCERSA